jgi:hypothetical protein
MKHQADGGAIYTLSMQPDSVVSGNYIKNTPGPAYGAIYHYEGSRYFTSTQNALCNVDARWLFLDHGMNIDARRNFTTQPVSLTQANSTDSTIAINTVIPGCEQLPASIVNNAGPEPAYRYLDPPPAPADQLAPTTPGKAVVRTSFPTIADLIWPASTDAVSVTGKPPIAPARSWSPSNCSRTSRSRTCGPARRPAAHREGSGQDSQVGYFQPTDFQHVAMLFDHRRLIEAESARLAATLTRPAHVHIADLTAQSGADSRMKWVGVTALRTPD